MFCGWCKGRRTRGGAERLRLQVMPQLQTESPRPWRDDLPGFVSARGMRPPPTGVVLALFIPACRFTGPRMQRPRHDISSGKSLLRPSGQEPSVDYSVSFDPTALLLPS